MNALTEAAEIAISLLHCNQVHDALRAYHHSLQDLESLFNDDANWNVQMYGPGLDGLYPNWYIKEREKSEFWDITVYPEPLQKALFVNKQIKVGTDYVAGSGEETLQQGLMLHTRAVPDHPDKVQLMLNLKDAASLDGSDYGLAFDQASRIEDLNGQQCCFLEAKTLEQNFLSRRPYFTVLTPKSYIHVPCSLNRLLNDDEVEMQVNANHVAECISSLDTHIAFSCPRWPSSARQWSTQHCSWPRPDVVHRVQEKGAYLVNGNIRGAEDLWCYSFEEAEKQLIGSFTEKQRICFTLAQEVLFVLFKHWFTNLQFRYAFFWMLEEGDAEVWNKDGVSESVKYTLGEIKQRFATGKLPHYFIPQVDMFKAKKEKLSNAADMIEHLLKYDWNDVLEEFTDILDLLDLKAEKVSPNQQSDIRNALTLRLEAKLKATFDDQVRLAHLQYFAQLYYCASVDSAITKISDHIKQISKPSRPNQISKPMKEILANILGSLHLAKAMSVKSMEERNFFAHKAEEYYLQSHNMDLLSGKLKLANYFYMTSRWEDCLQLLQEAFEHTGQTRGPYSLESDPSMTQEQRTRNMIWLNWINKNYVLPYVITRTLEQNTLPSIVQKNLVLAGSPMLGISNSPVCYLDPDIYGRMLQVLVLIKLEEYEKAFHLLNTVENICEKEHEDTNEKRNCTYLNIVAHCFELLGERDASTHNLSRSLAILPNPRNPARWVLMGYRTEKARKIIKSGLGVAAFLGVTAIVVAVIRSKGM